jgi:putative ABC transport system permease protein
VLPLFDQLSNKALSLSYLADTKLISAYVALFIFTGLLAGFTLQQYYQIIILYKHYTAVLILPVKIIYKSR